MCAVIGQHELGRSAALLLKLYLIDDTAILHDAFGADEDEVHPLDKVTDGGVQDHVAGDARGGQRRRHSVPGDMHTRPGQAIPQR